MPHRGEVPNWICGDYDTVALRVSAHPDVCGLCEAWGGPLVSTSANPGGEPPAITAEQCRKYFNDDIDYICPGQVGGAGRPTTIRDLVSGEVIRAA